MPLNDTKIKALKPSDRCTPNKPDKVSDGNGLQIWVRHTGNKIWVVDYRFAGKRQQMIIGKYPAMTLAQARLKNIEIREQLEQGINPKAEKAKQQALNEGAHLFGTLADEWHKNRKHTIKEGTYKRDYRMYERDIKPFIGDKHITTITPLEVLEIGKRIEARGASDIARRAIRQVGQIFTHARRLGLVTADPTYKLTDVLKPRKVKHQARIPLHELPKLLQAIDEYGGEPLVKMGFYILCYTFVRTIELRFMQWQEIDFDNNVWRIPAERMKMNRPHIVPLAPQVIAILEQIRVFNFSDTYVFFNTTTQKPYSENAFITALWRMGYKGRMTGHGFRGLASTTLHEQQYLHEAIELQLAHDDSSKVSKAYNGAKHLAYRQKMMNEWADFIDAVKAGKHSNVISFDSVKELKQAN